MKYGTKRMLKKIKSMNVDRLQATLDVISKNNGNKSKLFITADLFWNFLKFRVGYTDYFRGDYINLTEKEKATYVTAGSFYKLIHYLNNEDYTALMRDKLIFNRFFAAYVRRDFINLRQCSPQDLAAFLAEHPVVFAKDPNGECGKGISRIEATEVQDAASLYTQLKENKQYLVEEAITQCRELDEVNPHAVSSFRVVTLVKDGQAHIIGNALRINQGQKEIIGCTDDLYCSIGPDGRIDSNVVDDYGKIYETHPLTGKKFSEVRLPDIQEAFALCKKAALEVPEMRYVGWDIAFSTTGPVILEGNEFPGYGILQFYRLKGQRTGHLKDIENVLGEEMQKIKL